MRVNALIDGFLLAKEADGLQDTTLKMYRVALKNLVEYLPAEKLEDAATITVQDMQGWSIQLKRLAAATRDQRIAKTKTFFKWCHDNGFLASMIECSC